MADVRLKKFCEEKNDLEDQVRRLKLELEEERSESRRRENGLDYEKQSKYVELCRCMWGCLYVSWCGNVPFFSLLMMA